MIGNVQRRLAAIVSADVVGFSRLMGQDEVGTLARLKDLRTNIIDPLITKHGGRIVKTMGDGLLLEFPSVVNAVECSRAVQTVMGVYEPDGDRVIRFRIGVHLGDIIFEDGDIFGDGVNVSSRLQEIAAPSGIAMSESAYGALDEQAAADFVTIGPKELKNIRRPVPVWLWSANQVDPRTVNRQAGALISTGLSKPSIIVLPFQNASTDPEHEYFADGITDDVITDLSRFQELFVIARNTAFTYKSKAIDVRGLAEELGVHFVVGGSVRRVGEQVRVTAQLNDGTSGLQLWGQRFDGRVADIFDLQEEVTRQVVANVAPHITHAEIDRAFREERRFDDAHDLVQ